MRRRLLLGIGGWVAAVVAATGVGVAAVSVLEDGITGSRARMMDQSAVERALSSPTAAPQRPALTPAPTPTPGETGAPAGDGITRVLPTEGGKVTASCSGGMARLVAWSPAQGFESDDAERGPAAAASLTFESDEAEYEVIVTCGADGPTADVRRDDGHGRHGGSGGHGGGHGRGDD